MNDEKIETDTSFVNHINSINAQLAKITETQNLNKLDDIPDILEAHSDTLEKLKFQINDKFVEAKINLNQIAKEVETTCKKRFDG